MASKEIYTITGITPTAYYRFESGALTTDTSGNGHTLTDISDPAEDTGVFGGGVVFDSNDAYSITDDANLKPTGNFTIGYWIKNIVASAVAFQTWSLSGGKAAGILLRVDSGGKPGMFIGKNTGAAGGTDFANVGTTTDIRDGLWHFIVGTWDGSYGRIYIDGLQASSDVAWTDAPVYAATNYVRVGCRCDDGTNSNFSTASMDDTFLLNGVCLSSEEIRGVYIGWKKLNGVSNVNVKSVDGLAIGSVKNFNGL